jgi:hypothetical protein
MKKYLVVISFFLFENKIKKWAISGVLITVLCNSDDNRWLSFFKWLQVRIEKTWNIGRL